MSDQAFVFPTSFAQQRLWFLNQLMPESPFYNLHTAVPLTTRLNYPALHRALQEIVARHETLRTRFVSIDGEPMQAVVPELRLELPVVDLRQVPGNGQQAEILRIATEESRRPFDLATGPLLRTRLLRLGEEEHVLLVTMHHIIADGWSLGIFFRELLELYTASFVGRPSRLPELPIQYADFAVWQREWLQGEVLAQQLAYWRDRLAGLAPLQLPTDHRRPPIASFRGASHEFELPKDLLAALRSLARENGCTLFMLLLAAFKALLHRYTGQEEIVVGAPIANRNRTEIEPLIGFFVNTLVLRTSLSGEETFRELLDRVREVTLGAYAHQDLPFERLVEELQPDRDLSRNPLIQVTFQLHNAPPVAAVPGSPSTGLSKGLEVERAAANFDIAFDIWEADGGLVGRFDYSTDLFLPSTMERMAEHYRVLLGGIVLEPGATVSRLPILPPEERNRLLVDWNSTRTAYPRDACIHTLFAEQAARSPDAVAVVAPEERLTYAELDRRSKPIAAWLRSRGARPDTPVGICMERSSELIVGLLGILEAGAAYVALDPTDPPLRLAQLIEDAGIELVLAQRRTSAALRGRSVQVLALDEPEALAGQPDDSPLSDVCAESLAYIAYTSGSTGRPKGVCIPHRGVVRLVRGSEFAVLSAREVMLQHSPISFDASTLEIWGCLLNGGRLVVAPPGPLSLEELARTIAGHGVTTAWLTAGLFHQMVDDQFTTLSGIRQVLAGGDVVSAAHVKRLLQAPGERTVINGYGPTENTTFTCCHRMRRADEVADPVPIGRPIANTQVYILDRHREPVPVGVIGELYAAGDGLASGYLNSPELTAERFVPHPFDPGERLYRTGDLARYRADGLIEFFGRLDRQVKLRGFRVEPGEVESRLCEHPEIAGAAIVPLDAEDAHKRLLAYLVPRAGGTIPREELRAFLQDRLPGYLIPSDFIVTDQIPLTPNGKVDAARLVRAEIPQEEPIEEFVGPRDEVEEALAAMWERLLHRERVGVHDDFFADLGGHSLLATQLISRVREAFGIELPLRRLFEGPTVAQLAEAVEVAILEELEAESEPAHSGMSAAEPSPFTRPPSFEGSHGA